MRTPLLLILFLFGLGAIGLYVVYAAVILPVSGPVLDAPPFFAPRAIIQGVAGLFLIYMAGKAIWERLDDPGPESDEDEFDEPIALCTTCLAEVNPLHHYCPKCGEAVGRYTGYVPFVNIPFQFNFLGRVWHRVWREPGVSFRKRVGLFALIVPIAPVFPRQPFAPHPVERVATRVGQRSAIRSVGLQPALPVTEVDAQRNVEGYRLLQDILGAEGLLQILEEEDAHGGGGSAAWPGEMSGG